MEDNIRSRASAHDESGHSVSLHQQLTGAGMLTRYHENENISYGMSRSLFITFASAR